MNFRFSLLLLAALVLVAAACQPPPELRNEAFLPDTSLLSDDPCAAPCWNEIIPGETEWRDAFIKIQDDSRFSNINEQSDENSNAKGASWQVGDGPMCCQMLSRTGETVDTMIMLLSPQIQLEEILEKYGEPEFLTGEPVTDDQALMLLVYPEKPLVLYVFVAGEAQGILSETSEVIGAIYMTEEDMELILQNTNLYQWDGYGTYQEYIDGNFDQTAIPTGSDSDAEATSESE